MKQRAGTKQNIWSFFCPICRRSVSDHRMQCCHCQVSYFVLVFCICISISICNTFDKEYPTNWTCCHRPVFFWTSLQSIFLENFYSSGYLSLTWCSQLALKDLAGTLKTFWKLSRKTSLEDPAPDYVSNIFLRTSTW